MGNKNQHKNTLRPDSRRSLLSLKDEAEIASSDHLGGEQNKFTQSGNLLSDEGLSVLASSLKWLGSCPPPTDPGTETYSL